MGAPVRLAGRAPLLYKEENMGIQWMQAIGNDGEQVKYDVPEKFRFFTEITFHQPQWAGLCFGMNGRDGWAVLFHPDRQEAHFLQVKNNSVFLDRGMRRVDVDLEKRYDLWAEYDGQVLRVFFGVSPKDADPWPVFEFPVELKVLNVVTNAEHAGVAEFGECCAEALTKPFYEGPTFTNPVAVGADPDILLHDGVYYLYNRVPNDPNSREDAYLYNGSELAKMDEAGGKEAIFRVSSSTDLVHWTKPKVMFYREECLEGCFCMSPNVVEYDGWFYLFFAGGRKNGGESFHIYCASSLAPDGPFTMRSDKPLHEDFQEIGGMPFVDLDHQVYLSLVRFGKGNHIWLQKVHLKDGVCTADEKPAQPILDPEAEYEIDEYGRIVEGGVFIPHNGKYYMIYASGHYLGHYGECCAVADNIFGPYKRQRNNPILHHHFLADGTGDGIVIYNQDRSEILMGYHRHVSTTEVEPRVTCLDRMKFVPDPKGGPDLLVVYGPTVTPQPMPFSK